MHKVYVVNALRTAFGSFGGALSSLPATELAAQAMKGLLLQSGINPKMIDEVILGQVLQGGCGQAPARQAMRAAGIPDRAHAMTINKVCGSGLKAMMLAADSIRLGESRFVVAGGMENMSLAPYSLPSARFGQRMGNAEAQDLLLRDGLLDPTSGRHMGEITEEWIIRQGINRQEQDEYAARSYRLAKAAVEAGTFASEITPISLRSRKGEVIIDRDEEPGNGNPEKLPRLRPAFNKEGTITAGNASSISDGAAVALLASGDAIENLGLSPLGRLVASATFSTSPEDFAEAPVGAIKRCLEKAGIPMAEIGLFEINEAFSAVPLVAMRQLGIDLERVNVNGGAVALGHPIGASGGRLTATLLREMRVRGTQYGIASLCIGGGEAVAALFELA